LLVESAHGGESLIDACVRRLRPILMTSLALMAGTLPIAIGLNEASAQRTGMGVAILGGTVTSTLFTLFLIPCLLTVVERVKKKSRFFSFRNFFRSYLTRF
jgi:HAE1 family hydrophobic/amphiphilic exporter-1